MANETVYYKISESKLKQLLETQLIFTALENADVDQWEKYNDAIREYANIAAAHYLPSSYNLKTLKEVAAAIIKQQYKKV